MRRVPVPLSGTHVDLTSIGTVLAWLSSTSTQKRLLLGHNLHSLYLCEKNKAFRDFYVQADVVIPDGFPIWMGARLKARHTEDAEMDADRIGSTDWLARLDGIDRPMRFALVGATPEANAEAVARLARRFPAHSFEGWDGYAGRTALEETGFAPLRAFAPDVVLVGMGMPFQETWLARHWASLPVSTYCAVGGAIDQVSGRQKLAPRALGPLGLEWVWRLASDPRRLAGRYLIEPFKLAALILARPLRRRARPSRSQRDVDEPVSNHSRADQ